MLATNVSGWMCDFGESVPLDTMPYDGQHPNHYHTLYSFMWGKLNSEAITEATERNILSKEQVYYL